MATAPPLNLNLNLPGRRSLGEVGSLNYRPFPYSGQRTSPK